MDLDLRESLLNTRRTIEGLITDIDNMITRSQNIDNLLRSNTNTNTNNSFYNPYYIPPPSYLSSDYYRYPYLNYLSRNNNYSEYGINNNNFYYNPGFNSYFRNLYNNPVNNPYNYISNTSNISTNLNENQNINTEPRDINTEPHNINTDILEINPLYDNSIDTNPEDTVTDNVNNLNNTDIDTTPREANLQNLNDSLNETYREFQRIVNNQRRNRENSSSLERRNAVRIPNVRNNQDIRRRIRRILPELVEITLYSDGTPVNTDLLQDVEIPTNLSILRNNSTVSSYGNLNTTEDRCCICRENFRDTDIVRKINSCGHVFHINCVDTWLESNTTCPMCRHDIRDSNTATQGNDVEIPTINPNLNTTTNQNMVDYDGI